MRLLGYTRVSTRSQDAQLQVDALVAAGVEPRDIFADVTSGCRAAAKRPGIGRLLKYATAGDTVVVWRVDRLGRSLIDVLNTVKMLQDNGIGVCSVQDGIDPSTTSGRLMLNMLATLAEYERELITERVNAGIAAARQSGTRFGRPPVDPTVIAEKLTVATEARAKGPYRIGRRPTRRLEQGDPLSPPGRSQSRLTGPEVRGVGHHVSPGLLIAASDSTVTSTPRWRRIELVLTLPGWGRWRGIVGGRTYV